ncbi:hypothetical protein FQR65_LT03721 [Abscondita terminalis]|nr:hypothetical protein FQR65_LT03721 [Abscondita terminalis]
MSINVNVSGNPICIKRGTMVTADPDFATREFQKRRRIRLEQVRQQSKDIAANVRNRVQKEKNKQLSEIEKLGERELKKWQARKLVELQQQYRDCLKDIGLGHAQAILEEESDDALIEQQESYDQIRKERGKEAIEKVREDLHKRIEEKNDRCEKKKYNRAVENARSRFVSNLSKSPIKKKKKKKISKNRQVLDKIIFDSCSEAEVPLNTFESEESMSPSIILNNMDSSERAPARCSDKEVQMDLGQPSSRRVDSAIRESLCPVETRISDRIKRRRYRPPIYDLTNEQCFSNYQETPFDGPVDRETQTTCRGVQRLIKDPPTSYNTVRDAPESSDNNVNSGEKRHFELPFKPKLTMRTNEVCCVNESDSKLFSGHKVQSYDHRNRFTKHYDAPVTSVQRVTDDSIEVCPSVGSEAEYVDTMYKRDKDALVRGQKAMEKVRAQQDYKEMMSQLPKLQKKERLASLSTNKPEFHMSADRLKENERKRQNRMENAFEQMFPHSKVITIPSKRCPKGTISNLQGGAHRWDVDQPPLNVETNLLRETSEAFQNDAGTRKKESLQKMLRSLTEHRDKLANELKSIPHSSSLHKMLGDLRNIDEVIEYGRNLDKENRSHQMKDSEVPTKSSTPKADKRTDTQSSKKVSKDVGTCNTQSPDSKNKPTSSTKISDKKKTNIPSQPHVYRYRCKFVPKKGQPRPKTPSPTGRKQSPESSKSSKPSPDTCRCKRKEHSPGSPCDCEDYYKKQPKHAQKVDRSVEALTCMEDKAVGTPCILCNSKEDVKEEEECTCKAKVKSAQETCEIVIKICDEGKHKVSVNPTKPVVDKTDADLKRSKIHVKPKPNTTWKECLAQNSSNNTTSTSYYSPPEVSRPKDLINRRTSTSNAILRSRPQQRNVVETADMTNPRASVNLDDRTLLRQIKQLLSMSRRSVDELTVSTVSEVSTPRSSIINIESNTCEQQLKQLLRHLNIDLSQIGSDAAGGKSGHGGNVCYSTPPSPYTSSNGTPDTRDETVDQYANENYPDVLIAYNKMAETCAQKIENLTAMIETIRLENMAMLEHGPVSQDNSTKYYDLPPTAPTNKCTCSKRHVQSEQCSTEPSATPTKTCNCEARAQQKLTEELCKIVPDPPRPKSYSPCMLDGSSLNSTNEELLDRFNKLRQDQNKSHEGQRHSQSRAQSQSFGESQNQSRGQSISLKSDQNVDVATASTSPIWLDIPRLAIFTTPEVQRDNVKDSKSKPPPSKGITLAKCYNKDITALPHELSEILEVDSIASSKLHRSTRSSKSKLPTSQLQNTDTSLRMSSIVREILKENSVSSGGSVPDILSGIDSSSQILTTEIYTDDKVAQTKDKITDTLSLLSQKTLLSDSSTNDMETIETTLKQLGMGWAVTTIKKTQEALALTSTSSSSVDILPGNSGTAKENSTSSLKRRSLDMLGSSSSSSSALSIFLRGLVDTSQNLDSGSSANKTSRKTSTPVPGTSFDQKTKNSIQPSIIPTAESDISTIKQSSNDADFDGMQFYSLNEVTTNQTRDEVSNP